MDPLVDSSAVTGRWARTLTGDETRVLPQILADASAAVRAYTGQDITAGESTTRIRPTRRSLGDLTWVLLLPQRPVTAVTHVKDIDGDEVPLWRWDGLEEIHLPSRAAFPVVNGSWVDPAGRPLDVTYTHGYDEVPDDIVAVICQVAGRRLGINPGDANTQSEGIGDYRYSRTSQAGAGVFGLLDDEKTMLNRYRRPGRSITAQR